MSSTPSVCVCRWNVTSGIKARPVCQTYRGIGPRLRQTARYDPRLHHAGPWGHFPKEYIVNQQEAQDKVAL